MRKFALWVTAVSTLSWLLTAPAQAQDPVEAAPQYYKVVFENEKVRLLEATIPPGGTVPMHSHPAHLAYFFTDSKVRFTYPDGRQEEVATQAGTAHWAEPLTHSVENIGTTDAHILGLELKS